MKKFLAIIMALMLSVGMPSAARAVRRAVSRVEGVITEVKEDGSFLMDSISHGPVLVHVSAESILDGRAIPAVGQYVIVEFSSSMTKSLPPQLTAQRVGCYVIDGPVQTVDDAAEIALVDSRDFGLVMVHLPEMEAKITVGDFVAVYFSGVMALSYPGQAGGLKVDIYEKVQGTVTEVGEGYLLVKEETGAIRVNFWEATRMPKKLKTGDRVTVYYLGGMTDSLPPQVLGDIIDLAAAGE